MSKIEWTDETWNPLAGCTRVSPGCQHCYAERMAKRQIAMGNKNYEGTVDKHGRSMNLWVWVWLLLRRPGFLATTEY